MNRLPKKSNFYPKISYTCPKKNNFLNGNYQEKQFYKQRFSYSYAKKLKRFILDVFLIRLCSAKAISTQRILILAPKNNFLNGKFFTRVWKNWSLDLLTWSTLKKKFLAKLFLIFTRKNQFFTFEEKISYTCPKKPNFPNEDSFL